MTNTSSKIQLPFVETIKRTFIYFLKNMNLYAKLATLGAIILLFDVFTDFPTMCAMRGHCEEGWRQTISALLMVVVSICTIILYSRSIVLKSMAMDWRSFSKTIMLYFFYNAVMILSIVVVTIVTALGFGLLFSGFGITGTVGSILIAAITVLFSIFIAPFFLIFPALTVEDKSFSIKEVFRLAKNNRNSIFWGQIITMLPGFVCAWALNKLYGVIGIDNYVLNEVFLIVLLAISIADSCLRASYYAHIYQFFKFYQKEEK